MELFLNFRLVWSGVDSVCRVKFLVKFARSFDNMVSVSCWRTVLFSFLIAVLNLCSCPIISSTIFVWFPHVLPLCCLNYFVQFCGFSFFSRCGWWFKISTFLQEIQSAVWEFFTFLLGFPTSLQPLDMWFADISVLWLGFCSGFAKRVGILLATHTCDFKWNNFLHSPFISILYQYAFLQSCDHCWHYFVRRLTVIDNAMMQSISLKVSKLALSCCFFLK